ncbi:MAG TPA: hypothetical protein VNU64_04115 [Burkholderiales bacterium]|nr:hypothetical protein [Burkholderiales bacterium]
MTSDLIARREALIARSRDQRDRVIAAAEPLLHKAAAADRLYSRVRRHPVTVALVGITLVALGTRKLANLATRAMALYALFRR